MDETRAVIDLLGDAGFLTGLLAAAIGAGAVLVVGLTTGRVVYGWGLLVASAAFIGLDARFEIDGNLMAGAAVLFGAGLLFDLGLVFGRRRRRLVLSIISLLPAIGGAWWFGTLFDSGDSSWLAPMMSLTTVALGAGIWLVGRRPIAHLLGPLFALVVAGAWVTVPETDVLNVLVGVVLPLGLATLPPARARPLASGALALAGVFAWLVASGGLARPWTIAGGWAVAAIVPIAGVAIVMTMTVRAQFLVLSIAALYCLLVTRLPDVTESALVVVAGSLLVGVVALVALRLTNRTGLDT